MTEESSSLCRSVCVLIEAIAMSTIDCSLSVDTRVKKFLWTKTTRGRQEDTKTKTKTSVCGHSIPPPPLPPPPEMVSGTERPVKRVSAGE